MPKISDKFQRKRLDEYNINIKTKYIVGNKYLETNTDNSVNDNIINGVRSTKEYYYKKKLVHTEKLFDTRIEYTFISSDDEDRDYTCPNCKMTSKLKDFDGGCPYCGTYYNIDYLDKDLGSKYHYDRVLKNNIYKVVVFFIDLIISIILSYFFIKYTSRTFNGYDIGKVFIYGIVLSLVLYYLFYSIDAYVIIGPIRWYKDKQNEKQIDFWNRTKIDKKNFFNNLNYEIRRFYYSMDDVIDYDVIDYIEFNDFKKDDGYYVSVKANVRIVYFKNDKIVSKMFDDVYLLKKNDNGKLEIKDGVNIIKCHNCGASIDATVGFCNYCNTEIKYLQDWILIDK